MIPSVLTPKDALAKIYLRERIVLSDFQKFQKALNNFRAKTSETESEEFNKNLVAEFLREAFYRGTNLVNTKERIDLAIYSGKDASSDVAVLIESKSPSNKNEMIQPDSLNKKALHELISYFLRERITGNTQIRHLIITNNYEWFIFDAVDFEKIFYQNKTLLRDFSDWSNKMMLFAKTGEFYKQIAEPFIEKSAATLPFVYFDLRKNLSEKQTQHFFKILSPTHLLKLPIANDSNSLNRGFYNELLHIIGLEEKDDSGKKIIGRVSEKKRSAGTLLESTIYQLQQCYIDSEEKAFDAALDLIITWINRILFLKLLEAQLIRYNKNPSFKFLTIERIPDYDALSELFFSVLAKAENNRSANVREKFAGIPYLNSSLFELSDSERKFFRITGIKDAEIPYYGATVLLDKNGKRRHGNVKLLSYLFDFLDAFDFGDTGNDDSAFRVEKKELINAAVLGLIFEKLNGYKDGSFFTPGFITHFICRETIRPAVIQKFNEKYAWSCKTLTDVYNKINDHAEANSLINSLRICDPAVGSGHFLVSALNEIIAIKSELGILCDKNGKRLRDISVEIENDELLITDCDGELFNYVPANKESSRIQETLFSEKRRIIENCLFGADINPKSVHICRLRLWIELLKNAFYREDGTLETLPNIDINIKCGNSLISKYPVKHGKKISDNKDDSAKISENIRRYRDAVKRYKRENNKEDKAEINRIIREIKSSITSLIQLEFDFDGQSSNKKKIDEQNLFRNTLEWAIEFPEIIDDSGAFLGFDLVLGNPPYIQLQKMGEESDKLSQLNYETFNKMGDIYCLFYERGMQLLKPAGTLGFITSNKWMRAGYGEKTRAFFLKYNPILLVDLKENIFDEATVDTNILLLKNEPNTGATRTLTIDSEESKKRSVFISRNECECRFENSDSWVILSPIEQSIKRKIEAAGTPLKDWDINIYRGVLTGYNEAFIISGEKRNEILSNCKTPEERARTDELIRPILRGRDIKRYSYNFADLWLIFIPWHFPLHLDLSIKGASAKAEMEFQKQYPSVFTHLLQYKQQLSSRNKSETGIRYEWYALQRWGANYWEDFSKQKIVWAETMRIKKSNHERFPRFGYCPIACFTDKTAFILTGRNLKFLLGILNSPIVHYQCKNLVSTLDTGGFLMQKIYVEKIVIPHCKNEERLEIENIVELILNDRTNKLEEQENLLEEFVSKLYRLTDEEIQYLKEIIKQN